MEHLELEKILIFKMNEEEAVVYKLGLIYLNLAKKIFNDIKVQGYPTKTDPRKSSLFKHCYKMYHMHKDKLKINEFTYYIIAQLKIIKSLNTAEFHGPNCLVSERSWNRYLVWKRHFDSQKKISSNETAKDLNFNIKKTRDFLLRTIPVLNIKTFNEFTQKAEFDRFYKMGMIGEEVYKFAKNKEHIDIVLKNIPELVENV